MTRGSTLCPFLAAVLGRWPNRNGHKGQPGMGQSRISWNDSPEHSKHLARIALMGVLVLVMVSVVVSCGVMGLCPLNFSQLF